MLVKKKCKVSPYYFKKCPLCNKYICYFCKRSFAEENKGKYCCKKLSLNNLFFIYGLFYLKDMNQLDNVSFKLFLSLDLIPLMSWPLYSASFFRLLFNNLILKEKKWKYQSEPNSSHEDYINNFCCPSFIVSIVIGYSFVLSLCYGIINIYLKITLLIISLFTKFFPYKYYIKFSFL